MTTFRVGDIVRFRREFNVDAAGYIIRVDEKMARRYRNVPLDALPYTIRWFDGTDDSGVAERHIEKIE